jgi:hypothetical protein
LKDKEILEKLRIFYYFLLTDEDNHKTRTNFLDILLDKALFSTKSNSKTV